MSGMVNLKTHLKKVRELEKTMTFDIRGFNSLNDEEKILLGDLAAILGNWLGEWEDTTKNDDYKL